jgi:ataxia telangiectasia mutated family protein
VEQSLPFGDYIVDKSSKRTGQQLGSHSRHFPGEWGNARCRDFLKNAEPNQKRAAFDEICAHCSPSFRFFFLERFGYSMDKWYDAKMRYTRSVAVNSIVGHILGIGDRHCSNILIHQGTGEVVHIDFGIVFEQGKVSPLSY